MAGDDDFEPKMGKIRGRPPKMPKSHRSKVLHAMQRAGGRKGGGKSVSRNPNFGRGAGAARVLSGLPAKGARIRRVVVKARFVKLAGKGLTAATAHLTYLQRDGVTREGQPGQLYGPDTDLADAKGFMARCEADRHQFRFIAAPEDSLQYEDLKPLTRKVMAQMETDLGTRLDWVAVDHHNTGHPHTHIVIRGIDDKGKDLIIAREYLSEGLRERVSAQVTLDLGPRSDLEISTARQLEVGQTRLTSIDHDLLRDADGDGKVGAGHSHAAAQALRAGRLVKLESFGLAENLGDGQWRLNPDMEPVLRRMGERGDIIKAIHHDLKQQGLAPAINEAVIHEGGPGSRPDSPPLTGRLIKRGLADEFADRHYVVLEATDGRVHYVDIGQGDQTAAMARGVIIRVTPKVPDVREVDRTVVAVAAANNGHYSVDAHLKFDPSARQAFAETHVRRLEAIRRETSALERLPDGRFPIAPNHLETALAFETKQARRNPVTIDILATRPLEAQTRFNGVTWLDKEWVAGAEDGYARSGFGGETRKALQLRQQWLVEEGLIAPASDPPRSLLTALHKREIANVARGVEGETGKRFHEALNGERIEGRLRQTVDMGTGKFAVVERARDFALVPWRPVLEKHIGKEISGTMREGGINWTIGRSQGLEFE